MGEKYVVGKGLKLGEDVVDLMGWLEKRVGKRSKQWIDMVLLPLVAAETEILLLKKQWDYEEPVEEAIMAVRLEAKALAEKGFRDCFGKPE